MKNVFFLALLSFAVVLAGAGCTQPTTVTDSETTDTPVISVDDNGYTDFDNTQLKLELSEFAESDLSDFEREGLIFMREEEKLAHDVYAFLYDTWGQNIFNNISSSEQTHTDAVKSLLDKYSIADPAAQTKPGEYTNDDLQNLYDQLVAQGSISLVEALKVGAIIEEVDILDLEKYLKDLDNEEIILVYENLLRGSRNHLRAFEKNLDQQGVDYSPQYLDEGAYQETIDSEVERGNGGFGGRK